MAKKDVIDDAPDVNDAPDSNIEHINKLITDSDELEVKEDNHNYENTDEAAAEESEDKPIVKPKVKSIEKKQPWMAKADDKPAKANMAEKIAAKKIITKKPMKKLERPKMVKHKIDHKKGEAKKESKMFWVWIGIAVIILAAGAFLLFRTNYVKPVTNQTVNEIAATVNGEAITVDNIDTQYAQYTPQQQQVMTKEAILNQTIDEVLLLQEAKNSGIKVSADEISVELTNFKAQNQLNDQQLADALTKQNLTIAYLDDLIEKKLLVRDLLNNTILQNITISQDDIQKYYDNNTDMFTEPEKVTVQHILILVKDNVTDDIAKAKIQDISNQLNSTNFCQLVSKYTQDEGSNATCGTYTFGRGEMVPEFENASFSLDINKTAIVRSTYGYHLIKKLAYIPTSISPVSDVSSQINQTLHDQEAQVNFDAFMVVLRSKANIVNYLAKPVQTLNVTAPVLITPPAINLDDFAQCLTNKSVVFYGAYWCPHCQNNKALFGDSFKYVNYIECGVEGNVQLQTQQCQDAQISGYPTWIVNGEKLAGEQTLENLARLTGCELPK